MLNFPIAYIVFGLIIHLLIVRLVKNWSDKRTIITACIGIIISSALPISILFSHQLDEFAYSLIGVVSKGVFLISATLAFLATTRLVGKRNIVEGFHAYAVFWMLALWMILVSLRFDYEQNIAFISISNKIWHSWFGDPKTDLGRNILMAYGYLNVLIANRFVEIAAVFSMAASYCIYYLLMSFYGYQHAIQWRQLRSPRLLLAFLFVLLSVNYLMSAVDSFGRMQYLSSILISICLGAYAFFGAVYLAQLFAESKLAKYLGIIILVASWVFGSFFILMVGIGILDNLFGLARSPSVDQRNEFGNWRVSRRAFSYFAITLGVFTIIIIAAIYMGLWERFLDPEHWQEREDSTMRGKILIDIVSNDKGSMVRIKSHKRAFQMDMYEYPPQAGQQPLRNVDYLQARHLCRESGKRMCSEGEWEFACRGPKGLMYQFADDWISAIRQIQKNCNVHLDAGKKMKPWTNAPSQCFGKWPIYNMTGNVWEWIQYPKSEYFRALKGGSYQHGGEKNTKCAYELMILNTQIPFIDLSSVGFRCCSDGE